jgi:hypothetical protein
MNIRADVQTMSPAGEGTSLRAVGDLSGAKSEASA